MDTESRSRGRRPRHRWAALLAGLAGLAALAVLAGLIAAATIAFEPSSGARERPARLDEPRRLTAAASLPAPGRTRRTAPAPTATATATQWSASRASAPEAVRSSGRTSEPGASLGARATNGNALGELREVTPAAREGNIAAERTHQSGASLTPSTTEPYWACPRSACEAIVDPPARVVGGRWLLPDGLRALEGSGENGGYDPADLQAAYGIHTSGGEAQQHYEEAHTIALVDAGYVPTAEPSLSEYRKHYGLPPCTKASGCFRQVNEQGEAGHPPPVDEEWNTETSLDLEMASAMCPHCHILLVESARETLGSLARSANTAARLGATEISNSYGLPEDESGPGELEGETIGCGETACQQLDTDYNHPGVVVTVAAGDAGYDNYLRSGTSPLFPAVSSTVIAVGGTALHRTTAGRKWSESVWWEPERGLGTGSGCSNLRAKPGWQTDSSCAHRTGNDVAAVAACETPVSVYSAGSWENVCGTSVGSPLVAGIEAHANEAGGAVPSADAFYADRGALYDVANGRNDSSCTPEYLCNAEKQEGGYDGPAGNGTPGSGGVVAASEPPSVRTEPPTRGNTLNGVLDPNGLETTYCFEYGTETTYGTCVPAAEASAGSGTLARAASQSIPGLAPGIYHYRLTAKNADGTAHGEDQILDTAPPTLAAIAPAYGSDLGGTHVTLTGSNFVDVTAVRFGSTAATSFKVESEGQITAVSPAGAGSVDVTVETLAGTSATSEVDKFAYIHKLEYKNWLLAGTLADKLLGEAIKLPEQSRFNGSGELNTGTGAGSVRGNLAIPPFSTPLTFFGQLHVTLGMTLSEIGPLEGVVASSETASGEETLTAAAKLGVRVTSVGLLGLTIPTSCATTEPVTLALADTLSREALLSTGWSFAGTFTLPRFRCEGGFLGFAFGRVLSELLSGPENAHSLNLGP
jgi:hypothetical protein